MKPRHLEILQHALGADRFGQGKDVGHGEFNRNHFCAGAADEADCRELVAAGLMKEHKHTEVFPYYNCSVTDAGKQAMKEHSPPPPKLTRSQVRFRKYLAHQSGLSFKEWLQRGYR